MAFVKRSYEEIQENILTQITRGVVNEKYTYDVNRSKYKLGNTPVKEIVKVEKEIAFVNKKLSNEQFLSKAPPEVVHQEKGRATEYQLLKEKLEENLRKVREALG